MKPSHWIKIFDDSELLASPTVRWAVKALLASYGYDPRYYRQIIDEPYHGVYYTDTDTGQLSSIDCFALENDGSRVALKLLRTGDERFIARSSDLSLSPGEEFYLESRSPALDAVCKSARMIPVEEADLIKRLAVEPVTLDRHDMSLFYRLIDGRRVACRIHSSMLEPSEDEVTDSDS